jgi:1-acyl-sn-glycerol-3-phosphate acyltransferase
MILVIAPEGTRSRAEAWRSGFYRIAAAAGVRIVPASVNGPERLVTIAPPKWTSGDMKADMDELRKFFAGVDGVRPGNETPIRLVEEDGLV